jgi:hypothetical protein
MAFDEMTIAEGLRELDRIKSLLENRYRNIAKYSSKVKRDKDAIEKQQEYVDREAQSAKDLIERYKNIKLAIDSANLETTFMYNEQTLSIKEAIFYKHFLADMYNDLYNSFSDYTAMRGIERYHMPNMSEEDLTKLDFVPHLFYNERDVQTKKENLLSLMAMIDALIDKANHSTTIKIPQ